MPLFRRVTIIGLGLIGGSLGMALKKQGVARGVCGVARKASTIRRAVARKAIDRGTVRLAEVLEGADLVVIATPPAAVEKVARRVVAHTRHRFILMDVASTKKEIVSSVERMLPSRIAFVGSHPMAGSEQSGISAADPKLFQGAPCVVTRTPKTNPRALAKVSALWRALGGRVVVLDPFSHDQRVAQVSHVPHLVAAGLMLSADSSARRLAAGGFADTTRVALSDPQLWGQVCMTNRREILRALDRFLYRIGELRVMLNEGDAAGLRRRLAQARQRRRRVRR